MGVKECFGQELRENVGSGRMPGSLGCGRQLKKKRMSNGMLGSGVVGNDFGTLAPSEASGHRKSRRTLVTSRVLDCVVC